MNLHLFNDEKVVNRTVQYFEDALPGQNKFIVIVPNKEYELKYVKKNPLILCLVYDTPDFWSVVGDVSHYKFIIIHFLDTTKASFINKIDHDGIVWVAWGADLYSNLLEPKGYSLYDNMKIKRFTYSWKRKIFSPLAKILDLIKFNSRLKAVYKVKYFAGLGIDYQLLKLYYPKLKDIEFKPFFYYPLDDVVPSLKTYGVNKSLSVMVGNSGSLTGNHELSFSFLSKAYNGKGYTIYCPLSYGNKKYISAVISSGVKYFGDRFIALTDFLPLKEYNKVMSECNSFIYGNFRQEAVGNILVALYLGKKVFLHPKNPLLKYFKSLGLIVFDFSMLSDEIDSYLEADIQLKNSSIIWGLNNYKYLISLIKSEFN